MTSTHTAQEPVFEYSAPVRRLLAVGCPKAGKKWPNYLALYGLAGEHFDELARLVADPVYNKGDPDSAAVWGPLYAWRALGQLRDARAVPVLLDYLAPDPDDDYASSDFPIVFAMIGPAALSPLGEFFLSPTTPAMSAAVAADALAHLAQSHPEIGNECIALLERRLPSDDDCVNGFVLAALMELGALESIDAIREAFSRDAVDVSIAGDLEDVEISFGIRQTRSTPRPTNPLLETFAALRQNTSTAGGYAPFGGQPKIGRNESCPCGSGKKYKRCCLNAPKITAG